MLDLELPGDSKVLKGRPIKKKRESNWFFGKPGYTTLKSDSGLFARNQRWPLYLIVAYVRKLDTSKDESFLYFLFSTTKEFSEWQNKFDPQDRCFHEVISSIKPFKLHFDIDVEETETLFGPDLCKEGETALKALVNGIQDLFPHISNTDILVFSSHGEKKRSYHVICNSYSVNHIEYIGIHQYLSRYVRYLDPATKSKLHNLRILGSTKLETNRVKVFSGFGLSDIPNELQDEEMLDASLVTNIDDCEPLVVPKEIVNSVNARKYKHEAIPEGHVRDSVEIFLELEGDHFKYSYCSENMIIMKRFEKSYCSLCEREHANENPFLVFTQGILYFHCRRSGIRKAIGAQIGDTIQKIREENIKGSPCLGKSRDLLNSGVARSYIKIQDMQKFSKGVSIFDTHINSETFKYVGREGLLSGKDLFGP